MLQPPPPACCARAACRRRTSPLTCVAVCSLVLTYNLLGAFLFLALEGGATEPERDSPAAASASDRSPPPPLGDELRSHTVERLWSITEDLNILYKENWTKLAARELMDFQRVLLESAREVREDLDGGKGLEARGRRRASRRDPPYRWTFAGCFLYALTLITTIGAGGVTPRSAAGRLVAVAYASAGIPLVLLYLSTLGAALAARARALAARVRRAPRHHARAVTACASPRTPFQAALNLDSFGAGDRWPCREHARVPVGLSLLLVVLYVALGTFVFQTTERWSVVDGCYFSFASLATIGFGELQPGLYASTVSAAAEDVAVGVCCVYILVGIVVVATCFDLVQEEVNGVLRGWGGRSVHGLEIRENKMTLAVLS